MSSKTNPGGMHYRFGTYEVDSARRLLLKAGEIVPITGKAFDLLVLLIEERERIVDKAELMDRVWPETAVEEANLTQTVSMLRKVLGEKAGDNKYIVTVTGRGYQFVAPLHPEAPARPTPSWAPFRRAAAVIVGLGICATAIAILTPKMLTRDQPPVTVRLTSLTGEETQPAFSPDGRQIAFVWGGEDGRNQDIYVTLLGTGSTLRLTSDPANDSSPMWSPDGRYIAFHRDSARPAFFTIPALGGAETKIIEVQPGGKSVGRKLTWSPDGRALIVSARPERNAPRQLVRVSLDNNERRPLTRPTQPWGDEEPVFSPDGKWMAFVRGFIQLRVARVDASDERMLTFASGIRGLAWTPDSQNILYAFIRSSGNNLWSIPVTGGAPKLVRVSGEAAFPTISKVDGKLVYSDSKLNINVWRLLLAPDGSPINSESSYTRLIRSSQSQVSPQISPDGKRVVFVSDRSGSREIWVCDMEGNNARQLTSFAGPHVGTPRWSPDSASIVFDARLANSPDIYEVSADGGAPRRVTDHAGDDVTPSYSRDGRWIYFTSNRTGRSEIWRVTVHGGQPDQITRVGAAVPMESYDGRFIYYSKFSEEPGLFRVPSTGGMETLVTPAVGAWGWWALSNDGIWFIERDRTANTGLLKFLPNSGPVKTVRMLPDLPTDTEHVLAADRSGRTVLLQQIDERFGDLVMVERFQ